MRAGGPNWAPSGRYKKAHKVNWHCISINQWSASGRTAGSEFAATMGLNALLSSFNFLGHS